MARPQNRTFSLPTQLRSEYFWKQVKIKTESECWLWGGYKDPIGYGRIAWPPFTSVLAHRLAYFLHYERQPLKLHVLHKCDCPSCCNPNHLFLGTAKDNALDAMSKQRHTHGSKTNTAKLSEVDVATILTLIDKGVRNCQIARMYSLDRSTISRIKTRKRWRYVCQDGVATGGACESSELAVPESSES